MPAAIGTIVSSPSYQTAFLVVTEFTDPTTKEEFSSYEYAPDYKTGLAEVDRLSQDSISSLHDLDQRQRVYAMTPELRAMGNPLQWNPVSTVELYPRYEAVQIMNEIIQQYHPGNQPDTLTACQNGTIFPRDSGQNGMSAYNAYYPNG